MAQESKAESGKQFARDLRRIRESRRLTIEDLHHETKIPLTLLETFEETALFDHPQFNRVYLRSFVRTYANVVGIEPEDAIRALEEALSDRYAGSLVLDDAGVEEDLAARPESRGKPAREETDPQKKSPQPTETPPAADSSLVEKDDQRLPPPVPPTGATDAGYVSSEAEAADDTEWTMQSPPGARPRSTRRTPNRTRRPDGGGWRWIAGIVAVAVVGVVVWVILSVSGNGPTETQEVVAIGDTAATADTVAVLDTSAAARGPMPTLGDTLNVQIIAANDKADPVRVTVDDDLRRPFWIEQGDSMTFRPINRIVIEEDLDDIELSIEGASYPTTRRDEAGRVVITRDSLRAYFDSDGAE